MGSVSDFGTYVWEDLGSPTSPTVDYVKAWVSANLGSLNLKLNTEFLVELDEFTPELMQVEKEIYKQIFILNYYEKKIRDALNNILDTDSDWTSIREGDSSIQRGSRNEIVKSLRGLKKEAKEELDSLVKNYKRNQSVPSEINTNSCL